MIIVCSKLCAAPVSSLSRVVFSPHLGFITRRRSDFYEVNHRNESHMCSSTAHVRTGKKKCAKILRYNRYSRCLRIRENEKKNKYCAFCINNLISRVVPTYNTICTSCSTYNMWLQEGDGGYSRCRLETLRTRCV